MKFKFNCIPYFYLFILLMLYTDIFLSILFLISASDIYPKPFSSLLPSVVTYRVPNSFLRVALVTGPLALDS